MSLPKEGFTFDEEARKLVFENYMLNQLCPYNVEFSEDGGIWVRLPDHLEITDQREFSLDYNCAFHMDYPTPAWVMDLEGPEVGPDGTIFLTIYNGSHHCGRCSPC